MNLFSVEKKNNTWEILLTLPVSEIQIVLSKFLAALLFAFFTVLLTLPAAFVVIHLGRPDWGVIISAYLGTFLLIASYISSGLFFSSLTTNPIIAFISSAGFLLINFFLGQQVLTNRLPRLLSNIISVVSLNHHYQNLIQGNFLIDSLVLFVSWTFIFIWLTVINLKSRDY
jgi:ABC-2 type transport system permease protein